MKYTREELQKGISILDRSNDDCRYQVATPEKKTAPKEKTKRPERT